MLHSNGNEPSLGTAIKWHKEETHVMSPYPLQRGRQWGTTDFSKYHLA